MSEAKRLLWLLVLLAACGGVLKGTSTPTEGPQATPVPTAVVATPTDVPVPSMAPITRKGEGIMQSASFTLADGDYQADWTATNPSTRAACFNGLDIVRSGGGYYGGDISSVSVPEGKTKTGTSYLHDVPAGKYYVDASSGCRWSVTISVAE